MSEQEMLDIAMAIILGKRIGTADSDVNVVYFKNKIIPLCERMYEEGVIAGARHTMESKVTAFLDRSK